jgi:histone-lysine N-methyltransferase SETMAR
MVAPLATCVNKEHRSVIRFLSSEGVKPIELHRRMKVQYGNAYLSLQQVYEWTRKFMNGTSSVTDSPWPGQAHRERLCWLFWDEWGVIFEHYMPRGNIVNSETYADLLKYHLCPAIKSKRHGLLSTGVLLQHNNARPHTTCLTLATIQDLSFECLPHQPDLAPSDFHVFGPLKEAMGGKSFSSDESRWCMTGCTVSQKTFFLEVSMDFWSAGTLVWYAMETI